MKQPEHTILLVDDDPDDIQMLYSAFKETGSNFTIIEAYDGVEALYQLNRLNALFSLPSLIVLDINMPRMDGKQALAAIQANETFKTIPVVVFSTSSSEMDKLYFSKKGVDFITKPVTVEALFNIASKLLTYCKV